MAHNFVSFVSRSMLSCVLFVQSHGIFISALFALNAPLLVSLPPTFSWTKSHVLSASPVPRNAQAVLRIGDGGPIFVARVMCRSWEAYFEHAFNFGRSSEAAAPSKRFKCPPVSVFRRYCLSVSQSLLVTDSLFLCSIRYVVSVHLSFCHLCLLVLPFTSISFPQGRVACIWESCDTDVKKKTWN